MFFDSLLTQGGNRLAPPYQENFQYFLDTAQQHKSTEYGVGFDYGNNPTKVMCETSFPGSGASIAPLK
ncbi:hypothetical protein HPB52_022592 [Rhipicephalus sanguineus]|uniref:Uncharacterized protein n=1 Tax=Rhipicephalus sanguineus TaxID=34632 RepID=A0A9D4PHG7_RHISA|nr:hypothetical protein HPB52_022592 [Rhipicephalus sanguineus]